MNEQTTQTGKTAGLCVLAAAMLCGILAFAFASAIPQQSAWAADDSGSGLVLVVDDSETSDEDKLADADVVVRAKVQGSGWGAKVPSGETAGAESGKALRALKVKLVGLNGVSGSVCYKVHSTGKKWSKTAKNGKAASAGKKSVSAVRMWLKGKVAKHYDVYYRGYVRGIGWLDWAKNKEVAGTTRLSESLGAVQVKLVAKGRAFKGRTATPQLKTRWQGIELKYRSKSAVRQILEVKYTGGTRAKVVLRGKSGSKWKTLLSCQGYVGRSGIGKAREGDQRTPSGDYGITSAFGIRANPGSLLPYVHVTGAMYWCSDREHYNRLININSSPHNCAGEHLIDYSPHYDYGLFLDFNTNPVRYGAGSAIFVHCTGGAPYTAGCIAVSQPNMVGIIRQVEKGARICIYPR